MRRSIPLFFLFLMLWVGLSVPRGHALNFSSVEVGYTITGEKCYDAGVYHPSVAIHGEMRMALTVQSMIAVSYSFSYYIQNVAENRTIEERAESGVLLVRIKPDGNATCLFIELPSPATQLLDTFIDTVEAHHLGERFVLVAGHYVRAHYFCYTMQEPLSVILRYEWYFAWDSGVLLQFSKSIEVNLIQVQWVEYKITNSTLTLTGSHPITAFFTNLRAEFFAGVGAGLVVAIAFIYLVQKKAVRGGQP